MIRPVSFNWISARIIFIDVLNVYTFFSGDTTIHIFDEIKFELPNCKGKVYKLWYDTFNWTNFQKIYGGNPDKFGYFRLKQNLLIKKVWVTSSDGGSSGGTGCKNFIPKEVTAYELEQITLPFKLPLKAPLRIGVKY